MNKKGFTVIELIVSFVLITSISIILFQIVLSLRGLYIDGNVKTTLLNKQAIMTKKIYDDLNSKVLTKITSCGVSCLTFTYGDIEKNLSVDVAAKVITYDDYSMKLIEGSHFDNFTFEVNQNISPSTTIDNSEFNLNIPIKSMLTDEDFGIHVVKIYRSNVLTIDNSLNINGASIVANGINLELKRDTTTNNTNTIWAKIFHQDQIDIDLSTESSYFTSYDEFIKNDDVHKKSSLTSLEAFRLTDVNITYNNPSNVLQSVNLIEAQSVGKTSKEISKIEEKYQNGFFQFLLEYPSINSSKNNIWTQTSNFITSKKITDVYKIHTDYAGTTCVFNGIKYFTDKTTNQYASGCEEGSYFTIGTRKINTTIKGPTENTNNVNLWVNATEYINKYSLSNIIY